MVHEVHTGQLRRPCGGYQRPSTNREAQISEEYHAEETLEGFSSPSVFRGIRKKPKEMLTSFDFKEAPCVPDIPTQTRKSKAFHGYKALFRGDVDQPLRQESVLIRLIEGILSQQYLSPYIIDTGRMWQHDDKWLRAL